MIRSDPTMVDRTPSAFEEIEERIRNAIDRINGVSARLEERNDRLFGGGAKEALSTDAHAMPSGVVYNVFHLLCELHSALDRADHQIERQVTLV